MNVGPLTLRKATIEDAQRLFAWRNDLETRAYSKSHDVLTWERHSAWLQKVLNTKSSHLYIAEKEGQPIGTVRGDTLPDGAIEISYTVAPEARGRGIAKPMVQQFVREILPPTTRLVAHVQKGHIPSERVAESLGLHPMSEPSEKELDQPRMIEWR